MDENVERLDIEVRLTAFGALLSAYPVATVGALTVDGIGLPWPGALALGTEQIVHDRSSLETTVAQDHPAVLSAFRAAMLTGIGRACVRLARDPDRWTTLHYVDARERYGAVLRLVVPDGEAPPASGRSGASARFGVIRQNALGIIVDCDDSYAALWGGRPDEVIGRAGIDLIHPDDQDIAIEAWIAMYGTGHSQRFRFRGIRKDGSLSWREVTIHNRLGDPLRADVLAEVVDVSDEVAAHATIRSQELRLNRMAQAIPVGLFEIDPDCRVVYANDRLHQILGTAPGDDLAGLLSTVLRDDRPRVDQALGGVLAGHGDVEVDVEVRLPVTAEHRRCQLSVRAVSDPLERMIGAIVCVSDVTEAARARLELERDLIQHAFHDSLTGLANRTLLINRTEDAVARSTASGGLVAIVLADLDGFKAINDSLGHGLGDELLRQVSDRLQSMLAAGDTAARVGGDEFAVLLEGFLDPERPRRTAEQIMAALNQPFDIEGHRLEVGACIGIATRATAHGTEELLRDADLAMYRAKSKGRGRCEIFAAEMHEAVVARVELETSLRHGLEAGELVVFYQPIHQMSTRRVTSVEALVRWRHPTRGLVSPADFIPLAEETGLIVPLGRWVLTQACTEAASWPDLVGGEAPKVSVNLSARQLTEPTIVDDVARALASSGLDPSRLVLEITESVLIEGTGTSGAAPLLDQLSELGIELAIDDFGTGYSSLAYLQDLPIAVLKIDRAFVSRLADGERHATLIEGILRLARGLALRTVAEGVETAAQLDTLEALGCDDAQGYLFSRPVDRAALRLYLAQDTGPDHVAVPARPRPDRHGHRDRRSATTARLLPPPAPAR